MWTNFFFQENINYQADSEKSENLKSLLPMRGQTSKRKIKELLLTISSTKEPDFNSFTIYLIFTKRFHGTQGSSRVYTEKEST